MKPSFIWGPNLLLALVPLLWQGEKTLIFLQATEHELSFWKLHTQYWGCPPSRLKKAEHQRIDAFKLRCWRRLLTVPWTARRSKPVSPKGNQPWILFGRTDAEAEAPILWPPDAKSQLIVKNPDAVKDWEQKEKGVTEDGMVRLHHRLNGHEFVQISGGSKGEGILSSAIHGVTKSQTWLSNWTTTTLPRLWLWYVSF